MKYILIITFLLLSFGIAVIYPGYNAPSAVNPTVKPVTEDDDSIPKYDNHHVKECPPVDDDAIARLGEKLINMKKELAKKTEEILSKEDELRAYEERLALQRSQIISLINYMEIKSKDKPKVVKSEKTVTIDKNPEKSNAEILLSRKDKKLTEIISNLKPQAAAKMIEGMDSWQGARIIYALESEVAAKILQKMGPEKAAAITGIIGVTTSGGLRQTTQKSEKTVDKKPVEKKEKRARKARSPRRKTLKNKADTGKPDDSPFKPYNSER